MFTVTPRRQSGRAFPIAVTLIALAAMVAGIWLSNRFSQPAQPPALQSGTLLTPPKELPAFTLQDQNGESVDLDRLRGQWTLLFFGYTHCPDICPDTLAVLNLTMKALPDPVRDDSQVMLVSVDPQRDTQEQLAQYVAYFNPQFVGARGDRDQLDTLTRALGVLYVHHAPDSNGNYAVDHSAAVVLLDPQARWSAVFSHLPHDPEKLAADLTAIRSYYKDQL